MFFWKKGNKSYTWITASLLGTGANIKALKEKERQTYRKTQIHKEKYEKLILVWFGWGTAKLNNDSRKHGNITE